MKLIALCWLGSVLIEGAAHSAVPLIIDTDIGGGGCQDVDDVAAVCIGNALADNGEVDLIAVVHNTHPPQCAGAISVLNHYYGRDSTLIGAYKGNDLKVSKPLRYVQALVDNFPSPIKNSSQVPDAVVVYRRALAAQADRSVVISSIGLLTNLAALLKSGADEHSSLNGTELVEQKVKLLAVMGGTYPSGGECNLQGGNSPDHPAAAAASGFVFSHWPPSVRVLFNGNEIGASVYSGRPLSSCVPPNNPCRQAFAAATPEVVDPTKGRWSFDPLTTLAAIRGVDKVGLVDCTYCEGKNYVDPVTGNNKWIPGRESNQSYVLLHDRDAAQMALDTLLCQPARHSPPEPVPPSLPGMCSLKVGATTGAVPERTSFGGGNYESAWDGYTYSFYDYANASGGWTSGSLIKHVRVDAIQYFPRRNYLDRYVGGEFIGETPDGGTVSLMNITGQPHQDWNTLFVNVNEVLAGVTYRGPPNSNGNMAEIRLYTKCSNADGLFVV